MGIAYYVLGSGPPLIYMPQPLFTSTQTALRLPETRRWYGRLAQTNMLVRYDFRGSGLSQHGIPDYSLGRMGLDLEAVADSLGIESVNLWAEHDSGPIAIAYAAHHPERVRALVLWCSWARAADILDKSALEAMETMIETNIRLYHEVIHETIGGVPPTDARRIGAIHSEASTPDDLKRFMDQAWHFDVTSLLPSIRCPTLVLHPREQELLQLDLDARLAAGIAGSQLLVLERQTGLPGLNDIEAVASIVDEFLAGPDAAAGRGLPERDFHTILFTDIEGSTALTERLGDARAREVLREHERITRESLRAHGGSEVKTMGDGFMASFGSATRALECAIAMQRAFEAWNAARLPTGSGRVGDSSLRSQGSPSTSSGRTEIKVRIGLNAGEPIAEEEDLFGTAVNLAARISGQAKGGEILVADVVRQLVAGKGFLFADRGDLALRGFEEPVRVYEVHWREEG